MGIALSISRSVLARSSLAVLACERSGRVLLCNPPAARLLDLGGPVGRRRCWEIAALRRTDGSPRCRPDCPVLRGSGESPALVLARGRRPDALLEVLTFRGPGSPVVHVLLPAGVPPGEVDALTPREQEVLRLLALGLATRAIAGRLGISPITVRCHVQSLMRKLNVHRRLEAVLAVLGPHPSG